MPLAEVGREVGKDESSIRTIKQQFSLFMIIFSMCSCILNILLYFMYFSFRLLKKNSGKERKCFAVVVVVSLLWLGLYLTHTRLSLFINHYLQVYNNFCIASILYYLLEVL